MTRAEQVRALEVRNIVEQIKPILAGKLPDIQSCVLAECLATWLAGWPKEMRDELLKVHLEHVADLVPMIAKIIGTEP